MTRENLIKNIRYMITYAEAGHDFPAHEAKIIFQDTLYHIEDKSAEDAAYRKGEWIGIAKMFVCTLAGFAIWYLLKLIGA